MKLLLIDATNVVMRCASIPGILPAAAVGAAVGIARRAVRTVGASHVIAAFDAPGSNIRQEVFPSYKANRTTDTAGWVELGTEAFLDAGIFCTGAPRFEADDVIATLVARTPASSSVEILSADSDLLALSSDRVGVWQFEKGVPGGITRRSSQWICEKYGIALPSQLTLYKALVGEPGDNVPGVPKIGPVRARRLIAEFTDLVTMKRLGVLNEHAGWAEKAVTLLSLYDFAPVPQIHPRDAHVHNIVAERRYA